MRVYRERERVSFGNSTAAREMSKVNFLINLSLLVSLSILSRSPFLLRREAQPSDSNDSVYALD